MTKKIFIHSFLLGTLVLILCSAIFFGIQYRETMDETYDALKGEAKYAASGMAHGGLEYLKSLEDINRITWIDRDGSVLYDSEYPDLDRNQAEFSEVREAFEIGEGQGIRLSQSGGQSTLYYAFRCADDTVLRLSRPLSRVQAAFHSISPVLWVFVLVFLISGVISFRVANQILKPVNDINLEHLDGYNSYPELRPLIDKLQEQKLTIREQSESREQLRREFSANVSHELKTPLTSISGFAELIREGMCSKDKAREFAGDIQKEAQRMIVLIDDIIKLSRLDEESAPQEWEQVDLYEVAEDVVDSLRSQANDRKIIVLVEGTHESVRGVWQLIHEMIYNLCDNAIKYDHDGGNVNVRIGREEGKVFVTVADDGIGIPKDQQARVFERFYRVDKSHSKKVGGTGLGLSIVKHGAQFHDAEVFLKSKPGEGTEVKIVFG